MKRDFSHWDPTLLDLAIEELTSGLEASQLALLHKQVDAREMEALEYTIAECNLAALGAWETAPPELVQRIQLRARAYFGWRDGLSSTPHSAPSPLSPALRSWAGWLAAAAVLCFFLWREYHSAPRDAATQRASLLEAAADLIRAEWNPGTDVLGKDVRGDLVWSSERQEGYMRFQALPPNDASREQYQLWIFDSTRADWEAQPVDGGVFDVPSNGEVIVPIAAKLAIGKPALFAVTLETPGGVVVSRREHLLATASP